MKAVLRGKLIALSASKKKWERAYTSSLMAHLKALEQKEANSPRRSRRRQEIIKLMAEFNQVETKPYKESTRAGEMAQWVRILTALLKVVSLNPSTNMVAHNHL